MTPATLATPLPAPCPEPWPLEMLRTLYPPAVPGGIAVCFTRGRDGCQVEVEQCPPVSTPGQAMRAMRRVTLAYGVVMALRSRTAVRRWIEDTEELYAALAELSNRRPYQRSWTLRNGDVITVAVVPAAAVPFQRVHPANEFAPQDGDTPR